MGTRLRRSVSAAHFALLVTAGVGAGLTGSIAGLASLISYPALLATGLTPVAANVTNTVALVFNGCGSALASRPELRGQGQRLRRLGALGVMGGATGGTLLLATPSGAFARIVPWLIGVASLGVLLKRRTEHFCFDAREPRWLALGVFLVAVYGGYFGAAAGVLLLSLLLIATPDLLPRSNAIKNVVLGLANAVAAGSFVLFGSVHWTAVFPLAMGLFVGGSLGPVVVRHAPAKPLRCVIALGGMGLAIRLGLDAYR
jgi:uncharacterized membrane protein YfcA